MANAVFNSLEDYFSKSKLKPNVPYAKFDLSHIRSLDCDFGLLYPIYLEDCLPGDRFKISNIIKLQALPLKNPVFNNVKVYTYYFYVPYYLLWRHFDRFISGGRDGTYAADLPTVRVRLSTSDTSMEYQNWWPNTLFDYMGFQPFDTSEIVPVVSYEDVFVSAFPFAAYQRIFRDYFLDEDVQLSHNVNYDSWFPEDDFDFVLHDGVNFALGESSWSTVPTSYPTDRSALGPSNPHDARYTLNKPYLTLLRAKSYNKDYFTSGWFSPQRGPSMAVTVTGNLDFSKSVAPDGIVLDGDMKAGYNGSGYTDYRFSVASSQSSSVHHDDVLAMMNRGTLSGAGFTVSDFELAKQIEIWMIRNMSVKARYNEFLRIHFDDAPLDERLTKPYYIGGSVQNVQISNVLQTSQTTSSSAQGTLTGNASSFDSDYIGSFHSHEYGLIMGLMCVMPEVYYTTGIDRHWTKQSRFDFYFPELADIEPQAVLCKELWAYWYNGTVPGVPNKGDTVFSYIGRYDEYRHHRSLAVGSLRSPQMQDFSSWVMRHGFRDAVAINSSYSQIIPVLDNDFVSSHVALGAYSSPAWLWSGSSTTDKFYQSNIDHSAWATNKSVNPFMVQVGLSVTAVRPLPFVSDPSRLA